MSGGVAGSTPWPRLKMCPGRRRRPAQHVGGVTLDLVGRPKQHRGVEVALNGDTVAELVPGAVEVDPPVEADDVAAGGADLRQHA